MISYAMLFLPLVSLLLLIITVLRYKYVEQIEKRQAVRGEVLNYSLDVYNEDVFLYPYIKTNFYAGNFLTNNLFNDETFYIPPLGSYHIEKQVYCEHIGHYDIGVKSFEFKDFFGFFKISSNFHNENKEVKILPRIVELNNFKVLNAYNSDSFHPGNRPGMEDYSEITEIKKYTPGLPLKSVHWKLSARRNELMAKKFNTPQSQLICLYVDVRNFICTDQSCFAVRDIIIESAIAVLWFCFKKSVPIVLCLNDVNLTRLKVVTRDDFNRAYHKLLRMDFENYLSLNDIVKLSREEYVTSNHIITVTAHLDNDLYDTIINLKFSGKNTTLIYASSKHTFNEDYVGNFIDGLKENGIYTYQIAHADEIKKVLEMQV
jgi:hypothetical protein